jgi:ParB family transcriptional regulator, chromosome partitioning protein
MRMPWSKSKGEQLELLDAGANALRDDDRQLAQHYRSASSTRSATRNATSNDGRPLVVPLDRLDEDPNNPRTEFPESEIDELADDIRQHGILQPIVVHPADAQGRYRIHFGAKRLRAARRAGLCEVPVVVRDALADPYAQVAENQKRHGLTPLDLAQFIKDRVCAAESNAFIARRLGMNLTTVSHHLSLLDLPPLLDQALKTGRCTSPRTLHELSALHETEPDKVEALLDGDAGITRSAVAAMKTERSEPARSAKPTAQTEAIARANAACDRLERSLAQVDRAIGLAVALPDLTALRMRVEGLAKRWRQGSDGQTP